jgi:HSP20 family protein
MALIDWGWDWDPWRELDQLSRDLVGRPGRYRRGGTYPPVNAYESSEAYGLEIEVPGVDPEKLELSVDGDTVSVSGETVAAEVEGGFHRRERRVGSFSRSLRLPERLDAEKVDAQYRDGVLIVKLPKAPEARARKIAVEAG